MSEALTLLIKTENGAFLVSPPILEPVDVTRGEKVGALDLIKLRVDLAGCMAEARQRLSAQLRKLGRVIGTLWLERNGE